MPTAFRRTLIVVVVLLALAAIAAPKIISRNQAKSESPPPAAAPPRTVKVRTEIMRPERLVERLSTTGTIRANESVDVVSEIAGKVVEIFFEEGRPVAASWSWPKAARRASASCSPKASRARKATTSP